MKPKLTYQSRLYQKKYPIVALTGGIASGKSTLGKFARQKKAAYISADELIKKIYTYDSTLTWLKENLPESLNLGLVDFNLIRQKAFNDKDFKTKLESFLYQFLPQAFDEAEKNLSDFDWLIYEIPLLFEKKLESHFDQVIVVWISKEEQVKRLKSRNSELDDTIIQKIIDSQISLDEKAKRADFVFDNSTSLSEAELNSRLEVFWKDLINKLS